VRALLVEVRLAVEPAGATITIDGRELGRAPLAPFSLAAGNHVIEVSAEGYKAQRREVTIAAGVPLSLAIALEAVPHTGWVRITSSQPLSRVRIDAREVGFAPVDVELAEGGYQIEVQAVGYTTFRSELVVTAGKERTI